MKLKNKLLIALTALALAGCKNNTNQGLSITPYPGISYKSGDNIAVHVSVPSDIKADSIVYLLDSVKIASRKDTLSQNIKTDSLTLGSKLITAKVFSGGKQQEVSTNVVIRSSIIPQSLTYKVDKLFKHDTSSYTEGLEYHDGGFLYESTGNYGNSELRKVDLATGKVVKSVKLDAKYFGEGIVTVGNKIVQLTYREGAAFVYDKNTFKLLKTFPYTWGREGWGMCFDGTRILNDDSTNRIWFLNKDTYRPQGYIEVYDDKGPVNAINELEYIDGKIYANVYTSDTILVINPRNGTVMQRVNMKNLYPLAERPANFDNVQNVLNGIAWDEKGKRLFVTGKKWPKLYQVTFLKK